MESGYKRLYNLRSREKTRPYDGLPELLKALNARGVKTAVLSNKTHADTLEVVDYFFPGVLFDRVLGQREGVPVKPDPAGALEILASLGIGKGECLYVGDTGVDMRTAKNADLFAVGVLWGFRSREELEKNGADIILSNPAEILTLL